MKRSVDFTVPLFKWDASHLQGCFYTSIKVDPMVRVVTLCGSPGLVPRLSTLYMALESLGTRPVVAHLR